MKHGGKKENWMMIVISTSCVLKVQMMQDPHQLHHLAMTWLG